MYGNSAKSTNSSSSSALLTAASNVLSSKSGLSTTASSSILRLPSELTSNYDVHAPLSSTSRQRGLASTVGMESGASLLGSDHNTSVYSDDTHTRTHTRKAEKGRLRGLRESDSVDALCNVVNGEPFSAAERNLLSLPDDMTVSARDKKTRGVWASHSRARLGADDNGGSQLSLYTQPQHTHSSIAMQHAQPQPLPSQQSLLDLLSSASIPLLHTHTNTHTNSSTLKHTHSVAAALVPPSERGYGVVVGDLDTAMTSNASLRSNVTKLLTKLTQLRRFNHSQDEELRALRVEKRSTTHRHDIIEANSQAVSMAHEQLQSMCTDLNDKYRNACKAMEDMSRKHSLSDDEITSLRSALTTQTHLHTEKTQQLLSDMEQLEHLKSDLHHRLNTCVAENRTLVRDNGNLVKRVDVLEATAAENSVLIQTLTTRNQTLSTETKELQETRVTLETTVNTLERDVRDAQKKYHDTHIEYDGYRRRYEKQHLELESKVKLLVKRVEEHEKQQIVYDSQINALNDNNLELKTENDTLVEQVKSFKAKEDMYLLEIGEIKLELDKSKELAANRYLVINTLEASLREMTQKHQEQVSKSNKLANEIEYVYRPIEVKERKVSQKCAQLEAKLSSTMRTIVALNKQVSEHKATAQELTNKAEMDERNVQALTSAKQTLQNESNWLRQSAKQQSVVMKQLQVQLQQLKQRSK